MPNTHTADATQLDSSVASASAVYIGLYSVTKLLYHIPSHVMAYSYTVSQN